MKKQKIERPEKACDNCRYYSQHYSVQHYPSQGLRYHKVFCGHCLNMNNKKSRAVLCEYHEDIKIQKEERKKLIEEILEGMAESLAEIVIMLKEDKY